MEQVTFRLLQEVYSGVLQNLYVQAFLWALVFDILTGHYKAHKCHEMTSRKGLDGLVKHLLIAALVLTAYPYLRILGYGTIGIGMEIG